MSTDRRTALVEALRCLANAAANAMLYSPEHRMVQQLSGQALEFLREAFGSNAEIVLLVVDDEVFFEGKPLERGPYVERLRRGLQSCGFAHAKLLRGLTAGDIALLVQVMARQGSMGGALHSTDTLQFGQVDMLEGDGDVDTSPYGEFSGYHDMPASLVEQLVKTYDTIGEHGSLDMGGMVALVSGFVTAFRREANPLLALAPLRAMDEYTFTHSVDVCILNLAQGMSLGLQGQQLHDLGIAAMLHDVGKLFVPPEITKKAGDLTDAEWGEMRKHPVKGAAYLLDQPGVPRLAVMAAYEHHMRYNLTGYPQPAPGWKLNLASQMTMISDCFDAMRTKRVYQTPHDFEEAAGKMLQLAGNNLNPALTLNFIKLLREMGEGALV